MTVSVRRLALRVDAWLRHSIARVNGGVIPFRFGRFVNARDRPELCARTYYEVQQLLDVLDSHDVQPTRTLDIGCGYGRLAPWLADQTRDHYTGVEPNADARQRAEELHPALDLRAGRVQALPLDDDSVDLVVSWTVLQHIPPSEFDAAIREIKRVLRPGGHLLLAEKTTGTGTRVVHPRAVGYYARTLDDYQLVHETPRVIEPVRDSRSDVLLFQAPPNENEDTES